LSFVSFQRISTSAAFPRSTRIPASAVGSPVKSVLRLILLSTIFTCVVFTELIVPVTLRFPPTFKLFVIVTSFGRPIVTAEFSEPEPVTSISFVVPAIVAI
jgi:hypothetical protein